jgi:Ca2+-binding EF-hand superfamily protein
MRPHDLMEHLKKTFGIKLKPKELGALVSYFDKDGDGDVSGAEFLLSFTKLGAVWRNREREKRDKIVQRKRDMGLLLPKIADHLGR